MWSLVCQVIGLALLTVAGCSKHTTAPSAAPHPLQGFPDPYTEPTWHPSGQAIAFNYTPLIRRYWDSTTGRFVYEFADSLSGLWTVNTDGSNLRRLSNGYLSDPDWDHSGTQLAYQKGGNIWMTAATDSGLISGSEFQLTLDGNSFAPSWRPDDQAIAFSVNGGSEAGAYVVTRDAAQRRVGAPGWAFPDWSPHGDSLVFLAAQGGNWGVCVADSQGNGLRMLWGSSQANLGPPRWAPAGGRIAVAGRVQNSGQFQLWVMGSDCSNPHPLTQERVQGEINWSPDGREIAYVQSQLDTSLTKGTVWIIDAITGIKRQLTFNTPASN